MTTPGSQANAISRRNALLLCLGAAMTPRLAVAQQQAGWFPGPASPLIDLEGSASEGGFWSRREPLQSDGKRTTRRSRRGKAARGALRMRNVHTDERIVAHPFTAEGFDLDELARVSHFMRDWRRNELRAVSPEVVMGLLHIQQAAQGQGFSDDIQLNSGYRTRHTNDLLRSRGLRAARNSFHLQARAADFALPGVPVKETIALAMQLNIGGVGGYPGFVHIDDGPTRRWGTA